MTQRERSRKARQKWQRLVSEQGRSGQTCGGVLPGAQVVRVAFLLVEEAAGRQCRGEICGSEVGGSGSGSRQRSATRGWKWY